MNISIYIALGSLLSLPVSGIAQEAPYDGLSNNLDNLYRLSEAKTFAISPENPTGEKGKGGMADTGSASRASRELGRGWKVNPFITIEPGQTFTLAEIKGAGEIQHIWLTPSKDWRLSILRMYWDANRVRSVEVPVGDFFAMGLGKYSQISSLAVCVNPGSGFNSYWPMPFREKARLTLENLNDKPISVYYQIDYTKTAVPKDAAYFHAQFRRVNPVPYKQVYAILDHVSGKGQYVGTYLRGEYITTDGGAREKSSSILTATRSSRPSTGPEPKTTLRGPTAS